MTNNNNNNNNNLLSFKNNYSYSTNMKLKCQVYNQNFVRIIKYQVYKNNY